MVSIIIALADPYKSKFHTRVQQEGVDIAIGLDVSSSMLSKDVQPSRLAIAKKRQVRSYSVGNTTKLP